MHNELPSRVIGALALASLLALAPACNKKGTGHGSGSAAGKPGSAAPKKTRVEAFQQRIKAVGMSTLRSTRANGRKGYRMTEDLKLEVVWQTKPGTTITPQGGEPVTATGETAKTMIDLKKPVLAALKKLSIGAAGSFRGKLKIPVTVTRKDNPKKLTRVLSLRLDDALAWFALQTVMKGKPLLLPGEAPKRAGKKRYVTISLWKKEKNVVRARNVSQVWFSAAGPFSEVDYVELSRSLRVVKKCRPPKKAIFVGGHLTVADRRSGKKLGEKKLIGRGRCARIKYIYGPKRGAAKRWRKRLLK